MIIKWESRGGVHISNFFRTSMIAAAVFSMVALCSSVGVGNGKLLYIAGEYRYPFPKRPHTSRIHAVWTLDVSIPNRWVVASGIM